MKRLLTLLLIVILLFLGFLYFLVPATITIQATEAYPANRESVYRYLSQVEKWRNWWPGTISRGTSAADSLEFNQHRFAITRIGYQLIGFDVWHPEEKLAAELKAIPLAKDSLGLVFSASLPAGNMPWTRIAAYFRAQEIKSTLDSLLTAIITHTSDLRNLYGVKIVNEKVQYADVLSTSVDLNHYPTTAEIYAQIDKLRDHARQAGAQELFSPMVNVNGDSISKIRLQVGLPINRKIAGTDDISVKWMMKDGNILVAEVTGPQSLVNEAQKQMEQYIIDYHRTIIAIPFHMHITDRRQNPDSLKWVTKIYYPVV